MGNFISSPPPNERTAQSLILLTQRLCVLRPRANPETDPHVEHHYDGHWDDEEHARGHLPEWKAARIAGQHGTKC